MQNIGVNHCWCLERTNELEIEPAVRNVKVMGKFGKAMHQARR